MGGIIIKLLKKFWAYMEGMNGLLLAAYLSIVLFLHAFIVKNTSVIYLCRSFFTILTLTLLLCPGALRAVRKISIPAAEDGNTGKQRRRAAVVFAIALVYYLIPCILFYPGIYSPDSIEQYQQAVSGLYNDWHPVFHTLLAFKIPLLLLGGNGGAPVFMQALGFAAAISYSVHTLEVHTNRKFALAALVFYLNPVSAKMLLHPWKDVAFAIGALFSLSFAAQVFFTRGGWLKKPVNTALFIAALACTTLFRHNAILFTAMLILAVLFCIPHKKKIIVAVLTLAVVLVVKYPVYNALDVQQPDQRQVETLGLPMNIIGSAVRYNPEAVDEEVLEFAYKIASPEVWKNKYTHGDYNSVKWDEATDNLVIEEYGTAQILKMTLSCILDAPKAAITGLIKTIDPVFTLTDDYNIYSFVSLGSDAGGPNLPFFSLLRRLYSLYYSAYDIVFAHAYHYIGTMHLLLLVVALAKNRLFSWKGFKRILLVLPVFAYNFGTMFLLTGREDCTRFFFYTFLLVPLYLAIYLRRDKDEYPHATEGE